MTYFAGRSSRNGKIQRLCIDPVESRPNGNIPGLRGTEHVGFTVPDLAEATKFFVDVIGCELMFEVGPSTRPRIRIVHNRATAMSVDRIWPSTSTISRRQPSIGTSPVVSTEDRDDGLY